MKAFWKYNVCRTLRYEVDMSLPEALEWLKANINWRHTIKEDRISIAGGISDLSRKPIDVFATAISENRTELRFNIHDLMPLVNYLILPGAGLAMAYGLYVKGMLNGQDSGMVWFTIGMVLLILGGLWLFIRMEEWVSTYFAKRFVVKLMKKMITERVKEY
jgi:hypothetical protein